MEEAQVFVLAWMTAGTVPSVAAVLNWSVSRVEAESRRLRTLGVRLPREPNLNAEELLDCFPFEGVLA
jgi:hypothetical protein